MLVAPSRVFSDCEIAIEMCCRGCSRERGWIDNLHPRGNICKTMAEIMDGDMPCIDVSDPDHPKCHRFKKAERKPRAHKITEGQGVLPI